MPVREKPRFPSPFFRKQQLKTLDKLPSHVHMSILAGSPNPDYKGSESSPNMRLVHTLLVTPFSCEVTGSIKDSSLSGHSGLPTRSDYGVFPESCPISRND